MFQKARDLVLHRFFPQPVFASLLDYHWELSKKVDAGSSNTLIEQIFSSIEELIVGKLVCGAGGGGFLQVILKKDVTRQQVEERLNCAVISKYEEKYLLVLTDNAGGDISYYGTKDDGSIGLVHELIWKGDAMEGDWYLDDEMISRETYEEYYNKYRSDSIWYGFSEESCNETIQEEISQTKDKLKM